MKDENVSLNSKDCKYQIMNLNMSLLAIPQPPATLPPSEISPLLSSQLGYTLTDIAAHVCF
ncbi:uncharacterized protein SPAPADRAFT_57969 [Spathaspora passalidarum NRRL Y-27907]|uniref:Uncharacterized protein n=1 Tax=Spathaspora passalidarum (strain NRRL Y-27907 / 11-Y1) TaxID=619300 RepID=G3AF87_SPAPN|nr:uncharacterized protein SPAPADRAFT_57969 [Spathaspora passalidarum NRRL Y-27907]EGW34876.1 hypothetical protein SPAPADRAFT_57969 [Spathaspora passalidarum NRRL Y-27907]